MLLGDWVAEVTKKIGVPQCIPCQGRQAKMNQFHQTVSQKIKSILGNSSSGPSDSQQSDVQ